MNTSLAALSEHQQRFATFQEQETDQDKCLRIAARHGVKPGNARRCFEGSEGCTSCPWKNGWSDAHRRREQLRTASTPKHQASDNAS
jgi:hypothetical protein